MVQDTRYVYQGILGEGSFGQVYKCLDTSTNQLVAVKVPKHHGTTDEVELRFLRRLLRMGFDPDEVRIVRYLDLTWIRGVPCIVLECLREGLDNLIGKCEVTLPHVRSIGFQLLKAISCLKTMGIVHGDIKPGNILVSGFDGALGVKLSDLGGFEVNSSHPPEVHEVVTTLPYRSPEVLVGLPASFPIDMWGVALVLVECFSERILFPANSNMDLIHYIARVLGTHKCFLKGVFVEEFFEDGELTLKAHNVSETATVQGLLDLLEVVEEGSQGEKTDAVYFLHFIDAALSLDSSTRIPCEEAFHHEFFTMSHLAGESEEYLTECRKAMFKN